MHVLMMYIIIIKANSVQFDIYIFFLKKSEKGVTSK